jgi:EAL domain-containing protein (putative c-di-GMP-specific phosphodiesterase class I)/ActR/RegA family two-component response regulator
MTTEAANRDSQLILLIDDDLMVTEGLAAGLEREGRTIITCNDVESAQLIVERLSPSHIVTDVRISGPFGFEGLDFIRHAKKHSPESRVILMTGDAPEALQLEASERGAVAFLRKPFGVEELESVLNLMASSELSLAAGPTSIIRIPLLDEILTSDALQPFFQPIVNLDGTGRHVGYEALARFRSDSPFRNPELLFNYAVRKQRVGDLEMACMRRSLEIGARLGAARPLFLNVHPDAFTLGARFKDGVIERARAAGVPFERIVLEITEQGSLHDDKVVLDTIAALQKLGVRFAFDDVGVAYSHLPFMGKIRPTFLKISQHFGTAFETDPTKTKIVANLTSLARDFNCDLILEGIEEASTAAAAADLGIRYGQGFFFGHPADVSKFLN